MIEIPRSHRDQIRRAVHREFGTIAAFAQHMDIQPCYAVRLLCGPVKFSTGFISRFMDRVRDDLHLDLPTPRPMETVQCDAVSDLTRAGRLKQPEADAAHVFRDAAADWIFPGLWPTPELVNRWSPRLRAMWHALRAADVETMALRPPMPTISSTVWSIVVDDDRPAVLGPFPRTTMAQLEMTSLRVGLKALAELLAAGIQDDEPAPIGDFDIDAEDDERVDDRLRQVRAAVAAIRAGTMTSREIAAASGLAKGEVNRLKRIAASRPDLLDELAAGRLTVCAAGVEAGTMIRAKRSDGNLRRIATTDWTKVGAATLKIFRAVERRDPDLARRVQAGELSVNAAGRLCGYLKPRKAA